MEALHHEIGVLRVQKKFETDIEELNRKLAEVL
jgi:hypothetical protein